MAKAVVLIAAAVAAVLLIAHGPIAQPQAYHRYADARTIAGIPHFWNVVSNLPFAIIGVVGLWWISLPRQARLFADRRERRMWTVLFLGELLTSFGSAYYHAMPSNDSLVWDRLVFSLILTSFFSIAITELVSAETGPRMLLPAIGIGLASVLYWYWSEARGHGDLRPYALVQFVPVLVIPILALLAPGRLVPSKYFLVAWILYAAAKACEMQDAAIYDVTGFWSGHTLKHLLAAAAAAAPLLGPASRSNFARV